MKNIKTKLNTGFILLGVLGLLASPLVLPTKTASAQYASPSCNSAVLNGYIQTNGATTQVWFEWGLGNSITYSTSVQTFSSPSNFSQNITNLTENTLYSYRAMARNQNGTSTGETLTFRTTTCTPTQNPTVNITADNSNVPYNGSTTVRWSSNNANSCNATGGTNGWAGRRDISGSFFTGSLTSATTFNITCTNGTGSASDSVTINVGGSQNGPTVNIDADDTDINDGDSTVIRWDSNNADSCRASGGRNGWSGSRSLSGSFFTGSLNNTETYTITCSNNTGSASDSVTVRVDENNDEDVSVDISADDTSIDYGDTANIEWDSDNADDCEARRGNSDWRDSVDNNDTSGDWDGRLYSDTTFEIRCENDNGDSDSDSVTVRVGDNDNGNICQDFSAINYLGRLPCRYNQTNNQPTVVIYADQTSLAYNGATTVRWSTTNATSCNASGGSIGWAGTKSIGPGSFYTGSLTSTRTYNINCSNNFGSSSDSVTVGVRGQVLGTTTTRVPTSYLLVTSSVDRNRPIVPTLDNTNPCPGDEINYSIHYQNIGTGAIRSLVLRIDLPNEVDYMSSSPSNPSRSGNTLIFNLGSLKANGEGTLTIRSIVRDDVDPGASLNFPATLSYIDPSGSLQAVNADVTANVCKGEGVAAGGTTLGASVFGAGFLPTSIVGWLLLLILILVLVLLARHLFMQSVQKRQVVMVDQYGNSGTTATHH